jgi:hypothetical protein
MLYGILAVVITYHVILTIDVGSVFDELLDHLQMSLGCRSL